MSNIHRAGTRTRGRFYCMRWQLNVLDMRSLRVGCETINSRGLEDSARDVCKNHKCSYFVYNREETEKEEAEYMEEAKRLV